MKKTTYLSRFIEPAVRADLARKMVFIGGPRQCGKTTLARHCAAQASQNLPPWYLNWDIAADRSAIIRDEFPSGKGNLILDEIHKYTRWRQVVKGLYDGRGHEIGIIVTGSARLDHYRRGGDSLQGRYHYHRLFPLTLPEIGGGRRDLESLLAYGGFPEPFLMASQTESRRWSREYQSRVLDTDLRDLERVMDLALLERLSVRLPELVGSPLSINALREDLQVSHQTVTRWVQLLENIYQIFRIYPFGTAAIKAVKKEPKHYHFDWTLVDDAEARLEDLVACHLYAWCCHQQDSLGMEYELRYFRNVDKKEVDFVVCLKGKPVHFIECKYSRTEIDDGLRYLHGRFPAIPATQIVLETDKDFVNRDGIRVRGAAAFLKEWQES
ncbi:MAG: ATP-binding protein [Chitinivibrionales bacterium]|nr:ATP-binding protein [Chitinivibrionales bacterium]